MFADGIGGVDWATLGAVLAATIIYGAIVYWTAKRLGTTFDERYKIVTAMATAYLVVIGAWRFLDERARDVAKDVMAEKNTICVTALKAAGELAADYQAKVYAEAIDEKDVSLSASEFQQQFAQLPLVNDDRVSAAMNRFYNIASADNWGRNLNMKPADLNRLSIRSNCIEDATETLASACESMMATTGNLSFFSKRAKPMQKSVLGSSCLRG